MVLESLARRFKPAGFEQPEGSRHEYTKPRKELQEAFYWWVEELPKTFREGFSADYEYGRAKEAVKPFGEIPYKEANGLIVDFKPKTDVEKDAGIFVSACYNQSSEKVIVFDLDTPEIWCIGDNLGEGKILINNGSAGDFFGAEASGIVINNGYVERQLGGWGSTGIIIDNGDAGYWFGHNSSGILIALKEPKSYADSRGLEKVQVVLTPSDVDGFEDLKNYLKGLSENTKAIRDEESMKRFLEVYGPEPAEKIEDSIKRILRRWGYIH